MLKKDELPTGINEDVISTNHSTIDEVITVYALLVCLALIVKIYSM